MHLFVPHSSAARDLFLCLLSGLVLWVPTDRNVIDGISQLRRSRSVLWNSFSIEGPHTFWWVPTCCSFLTGTESRSSVSSECIYCLLGWIYQLEADTPWHLVICDDHHKPYIIKCHTQALARVCSWSNVWHGSKSKYSRLGSTVHPEP